MRADVAELWSRTRGRVWAGDYLLVSLPLSELARAAEIVASGAEGFAAIVVERDEVSLTVLERLWRERSSGISANAVAGPYAVVSLEIDIDLGVTGYLLELVLRLAEARVPIVPQCAYLKDHLLVPAEHAARTVSVVEELAAECRSARGE